jgi:hypothetical protein
MLFRRDEQAVRQKRLEGGDALLIFEMLEPAVGLEPTTC